MTVQAFLVAVVCCTGLAPVLLVLAGSKAAARTIVLAIVLVWASLSFLIIATSLFWTEPPVAREIAVINRPIQVPVGDYVGSDACRNCHPHNHATWHDSYHRTMTQVATDESVIGDFDDVELHGKDFKARLFRHGKKFLVEMTVDVLQRTDVFPVVMTTGSHHRQTYWLSVANHSRELVILPYMFLKDEQKWIPRHSGYINPICLETRPELSVLAFDSGRWERACIRCHTTYGRFDPVADADHLGGHVAGTQAVEFGISCEACHGPGADHVRENRNPIQRYKKRLAHKQESTIVNPARLPHDRSSQVCGQCHSVIISRSSNAYQQWLQHGIAYRPGQDLAADPLDFIVRGRSDLMPPERPEDWREAAEQGSFWSDGMIRASGREYNGLLDSPCYQRGQLSCLSCHQMHQQPSDPRGRKEWADDQLKLGLHGNSACVQCHDQFNDVDQLTRHTHHLAASAGSNCYNCHMPFTTYGILKATRSHQITSPNVAQSLETGRPNACNQCHQDKTLAWTSDSLSRWYNIPKPDLADEEQQIAASVSGALRGDAGQRAIMAWSFGWQDAHQAAGSHWQAPYLAQLLEDRYDAVRIVAWRSLRRLPGFHDFECDPIGPPAHRAATRQRILQAWSRSRESLNRPFARETLIDGNGQLQDRVVQRLWQQRDDRPMTVNE